MALDFRTIDIPLVGGLNTGTDPRALQPPALEICRDVEFDDVGGLQLRHPFEARATGIFGTGSIANLRRVVRCGDELLLFTKDTLYSWNEQLDKWVSKGTHLAIAVDEAPVFATTGEQIQCDRAELSGTIVYTWFDGTVYVAAVDKETGSVLMAPTVMASTSRPRLCALATKILLVVFEQTNFLVCYAIDPASPATALAGASTTVINAGAPGGGDPQIKYDIVKQAGADTAFLAVTSYATTSYTAATITAAPVVTTVSKVRACIGPIAVASHPLGTHVQVIRGNDTAALGDYLTSALVDVNVNQAIGTTAASINQITGAFRSTTDGGFYRCYCFWSFGETTGPTSGQIEYNWTNTNNVQGTEARLCYRLSLGTRAFERDGRVYVYGLFSSSSDGTFEGPQLQNTYYMFRDDAFICGKAITARAGGFIDMSAVTGDSRRGWLPGVASLGSDVYAWCGNDRRIVPTGDSTTRAYADCGPCDVLIAFDDNRARRCVKLGETLYVTGSEVLQYDGLRLTEVGFPIYPWGFGTPTIAGAAGLADGVYTYKQTYRWNNAKGEVERSTTAHYQDVTVTGGPRTVTIPNPIPTDITHKTGYASEIAVEFWRTKVNPGTTEEPFYLVTNRDPSDTSGANCYLSNNTAVSTLSAFDDALADASLDGLPLSDETGTILEALSPPPAQIIIASQDRLFLAGIAGDPDRVWYSRLRRDGEVCSFHEQNTIAIPSAGGLITGLAILSEVLVVFRESAIYVVPGDGYNNDGGGQNYGPARVVSVDCGCESQEALARIDLGIVFKSRKGWYILSTGWQVQYIGEPVADYDASTVLAVHAVDTKHQVRVVLSGQWLVWDYLVNQWSEWTIDDAVHACIWNGSHVYISTSTPYVERTDYTGVDYGIDIETPWIRVADMMGRGKVRWLQMLGEYRSAHRVRVRIARDYTKTDAAGPTYFQDKNWTPTVTDAGQREEMRHGPSIQRCTAMKIRLTAIATGSTNPPSGEALRLTSLSLEVGVEPGLNRRLAAAQGQ